MGSRRRAAFHPIGFFSFEDGSGDLGTSGSLLTHLPSWRSLRTFNIERTSPVALTQPLLPQWWDHNNNNGTLSRWKIVGGPWGWCSFSFTHIWLLWCPGLMTSMVSRRLLAEVASALIKQPFQLLASVVLIKQPVEQLTVVASLKWNLILHRPTLPRVAAGPWRFHGAAAAAAPFLETWTFLHVHYGSSVCLIITRYGHVASRSHVTHFLLFLNYNEHEIWGKFKILKIVSLLSQTCTLLFRRGPVTHNGQTTKDFKEYRGHGFIYLILVVLHSSLARVVHSRAPPQAFEKWEKKCNQVGSLVAFRPIQETRHCFSQLYVRGPKFKLQHNTPKGLARSVPIGWGWDKMSLVSRRNQTVELEVFNEVIKTPQM